VPPRNTLWTVALVLLIVLLAILIAQNVDVNA
jgi:uncharacterized integral membrane protein